MKQLLFILFQVVTAKIEWRFWGSDNDGMWLEDVLVGTPGQKVSLRLDMYNKCPGLWIQGQFNNPAGFNPEDSSTFNKRKNVLNSIFGYENLSINSRNGSKQELKDKSVNVMDRPGYCTADNSFLGLAPTTKFLQNNFLNSMIEKNEDRFMSDFGLCRNSINQLYQSSGGKLPVKWMALESLKENVFSVKTDVWSYGVLLWELFTLGSLPYAHVKNIVKHLENGERLEQPQYCTDEMYELMRSCWLVDPERPTFNIICQILSKKMETATMKYNYVDALDLIEEV